MQRLDAYFRKYNKIDEDFVYDKHTIDPTELINSRRIDVIVKYYYIKSRETGENFEFAKELYGKHIEAFTDGLFEEHGNKEKNTLEKYFEIFDQLIDSFKEVGFDEKLSILPIGSNNELLDGAHRAACAFYFNCPVTVIQFPELSVDYGFDFFRRRLLDGIYLDFIAKEYVSLNEDVDTLIAWPKIGNNKNKQYIQSEIQRQGARIVYQKKFKMNRQVLEDLVFGIYREEHWVGFNLEKFKAVKYKADLCYDEKGYLMVYVLENAGEKKLFEIKETLREYFQVEKSSIHTADTHEESVEIANFLFNQDYEKLLHQNFIERKDVDHTFIRFAHRKLRYLYRKAINHIKKMIGKPV